MSAPASPAPPAAPFVRVWLALWALGVAATFCVLPYTLALQAAQLETVLAEASLPLPVILTIQMIQNAVILAFVSFAGLWAARKVGLGTPLLDALVTGRRPPWSGRVVLITAAIGAAVGAALIGLDLFVFGGLPGIQDAPEAAQQAARPAIWKGFLASFYGGIAEEIQLRLFLLSLIALALHAIVTGGRPRSRPLGSIVFWSANIAAAVLFGLGHLPATAMLVPLTAMVVVRAIVLNGMLGLACGVLFRRYGLETAMIAHFSADIVLHVLFPLAGP